MFYTLIYIKYIYWAEFHYLYDIVTKLNIKCNIYLHNFYRKIFVNFCKKFF